MYHSLVDLDAKRAGEALVTKASGFAPVVEDKLPCYGVEAAGGLAGAYPSGHFPERTRRQIARRPHLLYLFFSLDVNHNR